MQKATQERDSDVDLELRRALEQVSIIGTALRDIQRHYQDQVGEGAMNMGGCVGGSKWHCHLSMHSPLPVVAGDDIPVWTRRECRPV